MVKIGAQNVLERKFLADKIETISIDGDQIFTISVSTSQAKHITVTSTLDGEYQQQFQIITKQEANQLGIKLEPFKFATIADDKRNAHKVIAATLVLEIPEGLNLNVISNIGSVNLMGSFNKLNINLSQGHFYAKGDANSASISTVEGYIKVITTYANVEAISKNGMVVLDVFKSNNTSWKLNSINGDITVAKQE
mgnify:CR=1 FL=1|tara:strand:- start:134653 stop:135237 length:585 start_codon:yes stop_codon:yes gene_type:complete